MKAKIYTFGCKVNYYESEAILRLLQADGYEIVGEQERADVAVVNSCAVTGAGEQKVKKLLRRLNREEPGAAIVLTGCMAQTMADRGEDGSEWGVSVLLGNKRRGEITAALKEYFSRQAPVRFAEPFGAHDPYELLQVQRFSDRTRAFFKIEDGCNRFCSYCIIPYARGRVRSAPLSYIQQEVSRYAGEGYREVVLVGINLSSYGQDTGETFAKAVLAACRAADVRIRLGSLEPESMDPATLTALSEAPNFCPQFHIALQSGCSSTLRRMNRHYTAEEYFKIVQDIRRIFPNPSLTTDVMVGFPGETEEEFEESLSFVRSVGFAKVHIFPYSRRKGTAADKMPQQISQAEKKRRASVMAQAAAESRVAFLRSQVGRTEPVLIETRRRSGLSEGYTPNYTPVLCSVPPEAWETVVPVRITAVENDCCLGTPV